MPTHHEAIERAWEVLLDSLSSRDHSVWSIAVYGALPRVEDFAGDRLAALLDSSNPALVAHALEALATIEYPGSIRRAESLLHSDDSEVRWSAIGYLGECGGGASANHLISLAMSLPAESTELWTIAKALGEIGDPVGMPVLLNILNESDHHTVAAAVRSLGLIGSNEALPALIELLESDADWEPRSQAAWAIGMIGDRSGIETLVRAATDVNEAYEVRVDAAVGLVRLNHASEPALLVQFLDSSDDNLREWATAWCHWLAYEPATARLIAFVENKDEQPDIRLRAIHALSQIGGPRAGRTLIAALQNPDERWRSYAALGLEDIPSPESKAALIGALDDQREDVRNAAAFALGEMREQLALPPLLELFTAGSYDPDLEIPVALAKLGHREIIPELRRIVIETGNWTAVEMLAEFDDRAAIPQLVEALNSNDKILGVFKAAAIIRLAQPDDADPPSGR